MKLRRKLQIEVDNDPVSPQVLMHGLQDNSLSMPPSQKEKQQNRGINSANNVEDYIISIMEPSQQQQRSSQLQIPGQISKAKQNSLVSKSKQSKILSLKSLSNEENLQRINRLNRQVTKIHQVKEDKKKSCRLLFEKNNILQGIVKKQKIKNINRNFLKKIRRTSTLHQPVDFELQDNDEKGFMNCTGFEIAPFLSSLINLLSVIQIITLLVIYSISFVFQDLLSGQYVVIEGIQICSFIFYFFQIVLNLITVKFAAGKRIDVIKDIVQHYVHQDFWVDCVSFIILLIDIATKVKAITFFRMFILCKLPQCFDKIEKIEVYFIRNVYNEQYWELAKVFLVNFCYAHIIGILLGAMASLSPNDSWLLKNGLAHVPWVQKYVWSVYWATNIMLTVGFGDLAAANHKQAICLIFIQTLSCIVMAYNINRVGSIINNIRLQDQNRSKKFKIFRKLKDQNAVSQQLAFKINNYIEQSSKIKKKFNYEEDQDFLKQLPYNLRTTYLKQANKEILNKLVFFRSLLDRTLCNFSQLLETRISHPQQIIKSLDDDFNLIILRKGHLGYVCKKNGCSLNDRIVDQIKINRKDLPFLTSLDFISKNRSPYEIKSLQFSVLFTLAYETFIDIFRKSDMDYELYCFLRDKCRNIPDEFEVKQCQFCKDFNHFKFTCPRLHYVPYEQHVVNKYIYQQKTCKNQRVNFKRSKILDFTPMQYYKKVKGYKDNLVKTRTRNIGQSNVKSVLQSTIAKHYSNIKLKASRQENQNHLPRTFTQIQVSRENIIRQVIEEELLKKQRIKNFQDNVWLLSLDVMNNFNGYFSKDNPKYLEQKFSKETRMAQKKMRFKVGLAKCTENQQREEEDSAQIYQSWVQNFQDGKNQFASHREFSE